MRVPISGQCVLSFKCRIDVIYCRNYALEAWSGGSMFSPAPSRHLSVSCQHCSPAVNSHSRHIPACCPCGCQHGLARRQFLCKNGIVRMMGKSIIQYCCIQMTHLRELLGSVTTYNCLRRTSRCTSVALYPQ